MKDEVTSIALKLLDGRYQITRLKLATTPDGIYLQPLTINAPVYNENRICKASFYRKNKRNILFYKETKDND